MTADAKTYIDENTGEDSQSIEGTLEKPYKSLVFAYVEKNGEGQFLVRNSSTPDEWKPGMPDSDRSIWSRCLMVNCSYQKRPEESEGIGRTREEKGGKS